MNERYDNFKDSIKRQRQNSININHCRAEFQKIFSNGKKNSKQTRNFKNLITLFFGRSHFSIQSSFQLNNNKKLLEIKKMWQRHLKSNILSNFGCENKTSPKIISPSEALIERSWYF